MAVLGVAVGCALIVAGVFVFRPRPVPITPAAQPSPSATAELTSPFTGEPVTSLGPVLAVKIDNIVNARPQTGLGRADIVYVLPVEGGLSRFCAVFSSHFPPVVGPVRSARDDDLQLLRQFGAGVRLLRRAAPAAAGRGAGPHRRSLRRAGRRLLPGQQPRRPVQPVRPHQPAARRGPRGQHRPRHRLPLRPGPGRRPGHRGPVGVLPGRVVHLPLVAAEGAVAGLDGRGTGDDHGPRPAGARPPW